MLQTVTAANAQSPDIQSANVPGSTVQLENVLAGVGQVINDASASGGKLVKIDLGASKSGPLLRIPLPPTAAGKYRLILRLKFDPVDAFSDTFVVSAGDTTRSFTGADNPDRRDSDYRLWSMPFFFDAKGPCEARIALERPNTREPKTAAVLLDTATVQTISQTAFIESVRPSKVLYVPDEEIACAVRLRNVKMTPVNMTLKASELYGLSLSRVMANQNVALKPVGVTDIILKWKADAKEYGREAHVELLDHDQLTDTAEDYYNVANNVWKVAILAPVAGLHMTDPASVYCSAKTDDQLRKAVLDARSSYGNFHEGFAWAPDDVLDMTPTQEFWISGQGCYQHQR
ncbi:MAG: hypothetical protein M3Y56_12245, partial [Armatimonadota bacterium]|nr:hypothetical protein [Armatimonadota bacterium]